MNQGTSSIPSGSQFPQRMVDQRPVYDRGGRFHKQPRRGRPRKNQKPQYWVKK